mmetsp:Transcript_14003/g.39575  ORF Transcript_14003/g.39575 Transcript_14003/m.39575 type:complete len:330 (-) Transcript_14003:859-1848(-)
MLREEEPEEVRRGDPRLVPEAPGDELRAVHAVEPQEGVPGAHPAGLVVRRQGSGGEGAQAHRGVPPEEPQVVLLLAAQEVGGGPGQPTAERRGSRPGQGAGPLRPPPLRGREELPLLVLQEVRVLPAQGEGAGGGAGLHHGQDLAKLLQLLLLALQERPAAGDQQGDQLRGPRQGGRRREHDDDDVVLVGGGKEGPAPSRPRRGVRPGEAGLLHRAGGPELVAVPRLAHQPPRGERKKVWLVRRREGGGEAGAGSRDLQRDIGDRAGEQVAPPHPGEAPGGASGSGGRGGLGILGCRAPRQDEAAVPQAGRDRPDEKGVLLGRHRCRRE